MKFNKKVLSNGMTILHEKRDVPVTTVMFAVKYGSAYELESEKGIAHFIEHLCFKGTEKRSADDIGRTLEKVGGNLNAFTHEEITAYHVKLPSDNLKLAVDVLSDIYFNPVFPEKEIKKEANVICEEIKMYQDTPSRHVLEVVKKNLFKSPFGLFGGGKEDVIRSLDRDTLLKKHRDIYVPKNTILCVVGNNDFKDVVKYAEEFCVERKGKNIEKPKIVLQNKKTKESRKELQQANLCLGFEFPKLKDDKRYAAEVFSTILGYGFSSKLFKEIREKRGLVYSVKSYLDEGIDYSYLVIYAGTDKSKSKEVIDLSLKEFEKMKNVDEKELEETKNQLVGNKKVESESSDVACIGLIFEELAGDAENYYNYEENVRKVSLKDIQELSKIKDYASFVLS